MNGILIPMEVFKAILVLDYGVLDGTNEKHGMITEVTHELIIIVSIFPITQCLLLQLNCFKKCLLCIDGIGARMSGRSGSIGIY